MGRLDGKVAIVTGASTGIGRAVALRFVAEGARVIAVARRIGGLDAAVRESNGALEAFSCDVGEPAQVAALAAHCQARHGRLDVLVNNAGIGGKSKTRIHELDVEDFDAVIRTNVRGAFLVLKHCIPLMLAGGGGAIANMASIGSFRASPGSSAYITSKGAMLLLTRTAALEYVKDNIRVNAVCPGVTETEILRGVPPDVMEMLTARVPMGRMCTPEEVAALTLFLVSDEASGITGAAYVIDGGRSAS